ncbi:unnamed protein product [Adineta steineri]|uniref:Uncharacterized protein n=1 Tax=Adineta steineri TaxID=433720 RepID=A0A815CSX7_9BILA|nr:unnamed protein product [Adineta steineri]CAF1567947.1 unnamed protein product [Adineta steineri]
MNSCTIIDWNELSHILPRFIDMHLLSISLIDDHQRSIPSFNFRNIRTLSLGLREASFDWIVQLVTTITDLGKLKLNGLVREDGFVINQRWAYLLESAPNSIRICVNVFLQQDTHSYFCEKIKVALGAFGLNLTSSDDDTDCSTNDENVNRWWNLRVRTLIELVKNDTFYHNRFSHIVGSLLDAIKTIAHDGSYSELYEIAALSNVLKCNIQSVYPKIQYGSHLSIMNSIFQCNQYSSTTNTIFIFWSNTKSEIYARSGNAGNWTPNHFVPLLALPGDAISQNTFLSSDITTSNTTPTKLTTKNSVLTPVRVPRFTDQDDGTDALPEPLTGPIELNQATTAHRIKRKVNRTESNKSIEVEKVENERILARERSAARRAAMTSEEVERQRTLARERSAARRAAMTSEEVERQRILARERSAAKRAAMTSEEVERQRTLARERSAAKRAAITPEQTEQQRTLDREKKAAQRAAMTPERIEQQRAIAQERSAARRAAMTTKEVENEQLRARERSMARRAVASPSESELHRVLARERSSARRAIMAPQSVEQAEASRQKKNRSQINVNPKRTVTNRKTDSVGVEWPKPIELACKTACLKNFIQCMSMKSLEEGVCSICNIRCYKRDLRCVPYNKIPSIELLKTHDDLYSIIPGLQQADSLRLGDNNNMNRDLQSLTDESHWPMESSINKRSFICVNNAVLYRQGLHYNLDKKKRSMVHCDICLDCWSSLVKEKIPKFSVANKVWIGDVPSELQELTIPEQRLIAIYRHNSCIVKLHSAFHSVSTAQSALKGNCISFPQDIVNIAATLPLELDDLCDSLKIIFVGSHTPAKHQLKKILTVRKTKVSAALQWLKTNNSLYRNVTINQSTIDKLPNDDVPECLWTTMQISTEVEMAENERAGYTPDAIADTTELSNSEAIPLMTSAVLDVNGTNISSDDVTQHVLERVRVETDEEIHDRNSDENAKKDPVYVIPRGNKPTNEYYNPNLLMGIFPTLFPYGCGALEDNSRLVKINLREHIRYLLSFEDRRFEENHSFIFVVFNILQRRTACFQAQLMTTRPYFQKSAELLESLTSNDIQSALVNVSKGIYSKVADVRINTLMKHIRVISGHVMGSAHSRSALRTEIHGLCFYLGLPSIFVTINPADIHSPVALYFADEDDVESNMANTNATSAGELVDFDVFVLFLFLFKAMETNASEIVPACQPTPNPSSDDFIRIFWKDIIRLVETCNMHKHSATCYKYSKAKSDDLKTCRMRMPRALVKNSTIDPVSGQIAMRRSHPWINNFNEWLISACRSNMDIKFIWSGNDAKALVYYITDYITKSSLAFHDMFLFAQQGIRSIEQYRISDQVESATEKSRKLVLRCYNMIASHQEIAGVQVASYLMNFGDHYTTHTFKNLFLFSIENYIQTELIKARLSAQDTNEKNEDGNRFNFTNTDRKMMNLLDMLNCFYDDHEEDETK